MKEKIILTLSLIFLLILEISSIISFEPNGANITVERTERAPNDSAGSHNAQAGNVTELNIFGYSITQSWQGYFGNVSGVIQLADSNDKTMYNWTLASPEGEVYASTNSSINWANIQCFNFTANGSSGDESGNGGGTNLQGTNLSVLESIFNIISDDVDGVDETFTLSGAGTHDLFYTANKQFEEGECKSTRIYNSTGIGSDNQFEEVLLYEAVTSSVVFASLLEEANTLGFDSKSHDFEMLVLEDGHGTNVETTTYYFFVELE